MADLDELVSAHIASRVAGAPPPLEVLRRRARRRRQRQVGGMVAAAAATILGVGSLAAGPALPWTQQTDTARFAAPVAPDGILDEGVDDDGAWQVVAGNDADEGWCIRHITSSQEGGSCDLATPGRLDEVSLFATADGAEPITVVAGGVPEDTTSVQADLSDGTVERVVVRTVSGRSFFSFRMPADVTVERLAALDQDGRVVDQVGPLPPPPPPVQPPPDTVYAPLEPEAGPSEDPATVCARAYEQQVGREYPDTSDAGREAFLNGCVQASAPTDRSRSLADRAPASASASASRRSGCRRRTTRARV